MPVLTVDRVGGVATLTLNRPEAFNAFTRELALALQAALREADLDDGVRAVVITGAGRAFGAGQDLRELTDPEAPPIEEILAHQLNPIIRLVRACRKPVVAAVNGVAAGAGCNLALSCDIVLAAESATFIQAFAKVGLIPDSGGTWILPRLVGRQRATALMMLGEPVDARRAEAMGMVYAVVADDELPTAAAKLAARLAAGPTRALALTKQALDASATNDLDAQLDLEDRLQRVAAATSDHREGVSAFLEKRTAAFEGR